MTDEKRLTLQARRYQRVNALWPQGPLPPLSDQEAISAAKRLYRVGTGAAFSGKFQIVTGRRHTWIRNGVFFVNASKGWHPLVHAVSHLAHWKHHPARAGHHYTHAEFERNLIKVVLDKGWLDGRLRRPEPIKLDLATVRYERVLARIKSWESKRARAENALKKLYRTQTYYEGKGA